MALSCDGNGAGDYCTFGYKWGDNNPFSNPGLEMPGPSVGPVVITYKFQEAGVLFNTHAQENIHSLTFSNCLKDSIRSAFAEWQSVAAVSFTEKASTEKTDITVVMANIQSGGIGYPAFPDEPCSDLAGNIFLNPNNYPTCTNMYRTGILHEIGHVLGLGHVTNNMVMNPVAYKNFNRLQSGDIKGVQTIYGAK